MFKRIVTFAPVIVLCGVATYQMARAHTSDLTPWKGGGFGMFSTVDAPGARYVKVFLIDGDKRYPVRVPHQLDDAFRRAKCDPSQANLDALADYFEHLGLQKMWGWTDLPLDEFQSYDDSSPTQGGPPKVRGPMRRSARNQNSRAAIVGGAGRF